MIYQAFRNNLINNNTKAYQPIIPYLLRELYFRYELYSGIIHSSTSAHQQKSHVLPYIFPECVPFSLEEVDGEAIQVRGLSRTNFK